MNILIKHSFAVWIFSTLFSLYAWPDHSADVSVKLQWIDAEGQTIDLNWYRETRWIWKESTQKEKKVLSPFLELWIEFPSHLKAAKKQQPPARIETFATEDHSEAGQAIRLETNTSTLTAKINLEPTAPQSPTTSSTNGLLITTTTERPNILIHRSCLKEGLIVKEHSIEGTSPLFLGVTCKASDSILTIELHAPLKHKLNSERLSYRISKRMDVGTQRIGEAAIISEDGASSAKFELSLRHPSYTKEAPKPALKETPDTSETPLAQGDTSKTPGTFFQLGVVPSFLAYEAPVDQTRIDPAEYLIETSFRIFPKDRNRALYWESEVRLPLFSILPDPFHFPTTGIYSTSGHITPFLPLHVGGWTISLLSGVNAIISQLKERPDGSLFSLGPSFLFSAQNQASTGGHGRGRYETRLGITPLHSPGRSAVFSGFSATGIFAFEIQRIFSNRRTDIETKFEYTSISDGQAEQIFITRFSIGLLIWF